MFFQENESSLTIRSDFTTVINVFVLRRPAILVNYGTDSPRHADAFVIMFFPANIRELPTDTIVGYGITLIRSHVVKANALVRHL